jgi:hypothetical protein
MSFNSTCEEDFHQKLSDAKEHFYKNNSSISIEEITFCSEYARSKISMSAACPQFLQLIIEIGESELAKKVTELATYNRKLLVRKYYSHPRDLFQEIIDMRLNALRLKLD